MFFDTDVVLWRSLKAFCNYCRKFGDILMVD